jgi:hypothetical protein
MDDKEVSEMSKRANQVANELGDLLEKADVENGMALSILSAMLIDLAIDMNIPEADCMKVMVKLISLKYEEVREESEEESPQTTTDEKGITQWLN